MIGCCKSDIVVSQRYPLSLLLHNIYGRELGMNVAVCKQGFKYLMLNKNVVIEEKSQTAL